uniref:MI domain-containing protein n=1 Tax=Plectus sambesii TaxID=2011161 RepID=A0A914V7T9_9BILA
MPLLPEQQFKRKPSRKQTRKNERKLKKARKLAFSVHKPIEQVLQDRFGLKKSKKKKRKRKNSTQNEDGTTSDVSSSTKAANKKNAKIEADERKKEEAERLRRKQMREQIKEDELEIKRFAKKLGYNKRKSTNTPQVFVAEGLDYILDVCDASKRREMTADSDFEMSESSDQEDKSDQDSESDDDSAPLEVGTKKTRKRPLPPSSIDAMDSDDSEAGLTDDPKLQRSQKNSAKKKVRFSEEKDESDEDDADVSDPDFGDDDEEDEDDEGSETSLQEGEANEKDSKAKEDIYGRLVNKKTGQLIDRDPSGARRKLVELEEKLAAEGGASTEDKERLTRTIRGLVNRLNEATMVTSIRTFKDLYSSNSRNDVKQLLADCLFKASAVLFRLPDRLAMEYSVFLSLCHTAISSEITAYFVEALVVRLRDAIKSGHVLNDKSIENLCIILSHMCNFKVIKSALVLDFLQLLLENFNEFNIELILLVLTYAGFAIRREDPTGLKNFISSVHAKIDTVDETVKKDAKVRFILETLLAIKNNNVLKLSNTFDPSLLEHYLRVYRGILKSYTSKETPLPVSLDDLLKAEEKGRWWIVGSAWVGAGDEEGEPGDALPNRSKKGALDTHNFDAALLALAKKSKMNTELRRTIFCLMMSAEDEMDAFEKLLKLHLKDQQEREIIHIAVTCCMREKSYNAYYSALIDKLCIFHKRFQLTTQYAIWDRVRSLAQCSQVQRANLANLLGDLISAQAVGLTVLKVIEFGALTPVVSRFLKRVLTKVLTACTDKKLSEIFANVVQSSKFKDFTDGLQIFLHMVMKKVGDAHSPLDAKQRAINDRISFLDAIWGSDRSF